MLSPSGAASGESQKFLGMRMSPSALRHLNLSLPITHWLPKYSRIDATGDFLAGLTIGLMVVPQGMAYAQVAGLPVLNGLYAAMFGCFLYTPFGTAKDLSSGPTAVLSLLVLSSYVGDAASGSAASEATSAQRVLQAGFLCFYAGVLQIVFGVLRIGRLLDFISPPVISAFTSGSALTIASLQIKNWTGVPVGTTFFNSLIDFFSGLKAFLWKDFLLGCTCLVALYSMRYFMRNYRRQDNFVLWFICIARSFFVILVATLFSASFVWSHYGPTKGSSPFVTVPIIPGSGAHMPPFSATFFESANNSNISSLTVSAVLLAFVSLLEGVAVAKAYGKKWGYVVRPSQELVATGVTMTFGSFFGAYPLGGSFSRTAVNSEAGIRTPAGGVVSGILIVLALCFATPAFHLIPQASLAAVIIHAVTFIVDFDLFIRLYRLGQPTSSQSRLPPYQRRPEDEKGWVAWIVDFVLVIIFGVLWVPYIIFRHRHESAAPQAWWDLLTMEACFALCVSVSVEWGIGIGVGLALAISIGHGAMPVTMLMQPTIEDVTAQYNKDKKPDDDALPRDEETEPLQWKPALPVTPLAEDGAVKPYATTAKPEPAVPLHVVQLRQSVLCVRVEGDLVFYSIGAVLDFMESVQTNSQQAARRGSDVSGLVAIPLDRSSSQVEEPSTPPTPPTPPAIPPASTIRALVMDISCANEIDTSGSRGLQVMIRDWRDHVPALTIYFVGTQARLKAFMQLAFKEDAGVFFHDDMATAVRAADTESRVELRDWRTPHSPVGLKYGSSPATLVGSEGDVEMKEAEQTPPVNTTPVGISTRSLLYVDMPPPIITEAPSSP